MAQNYRPPGRRPSPAQSMSWASKHKQQQPELLCDGNIKNTTNLLTTNVSSTMDVHNNRISLQRSCQNNHQQNQNSSTTIMNWRSKRKIISRQKYHQDKHRIMSQNKNNNNFSPITNNYNSEKCNRSTTVSSKSTKSAQVSYSSCKQTAESNPSHCNVSQSSPSPYLFHFLVLVLITFAHCADACSSRSTPKPRPPSHSAMRPNITFQTYACPPAYAAWYCLNGATCFTVKIAESILYNCECADGYMGQRCEFKDLDGTYLPSRERLLMDMGLLVKSSSKAGPVFVAVIIIVVVVALVGAILTRFRTKAKKARIQKQQQNNIPSSSSDTISQIDSAHTTVAGSAQVHGVFPVNNRLNHGSRSCSKDFSVLSHPVSYIYDPREHQGVELWNIHSPNHSMMIQSRIHRQHLNDYK